MRRIRPIEAEAEYVHGHPEATGGILPLAGFKELPSALGFPPDVAEAVPG